MRTTLKRGMGRGAAVNGNGRAILPPSTRTQITRYRQPDPPRRGTLRVVGTILLWLVAAALMLATALAGGAYLFFHQSVAAVSAHSLDVRIAAKRLNVPLAHQAAVALVIGYDHRAGDASGDPSRSDTIMLLRADPETKTISMLSFPRDLLVPIHCPGQLTYTDRINAAYALCGSKGTLETVRSLTNIPINYLITVNFHSFKQIVDRLGGVWIDVDRRYYNDNSGLSPGYTYATINLKPGYQKLNGADALDFVRFRHTDNDLYRLARQQIFVKAVKQEISHSFSPYSLARIVGAITNNVELAQGGGDVSGKTILSYALFAYKLEPGHLFQAKIGGLYGTNTLQTDSSNVGTAVDEFLNPDVKAPEKATASALGRAYRPKEGPRSSAISLTVLNGNGVPGAAADTSARLANLGYQTRVPPNNLAADAPARSFDTKVYFDPRQPRAAAAAQKVANVFGDGKVEQGIPANLTPLANNAMLVVVLGTTFHGSLAPAPRDTTPKRQPPAVRKDPSATLPLVRQSRRRVPFPLQVPTVLEKSSIPDAELPVRVYGLDGHKAIRLTFCTASCGAYGREYWGIEETDWTDAPALAKPTSSHTIKGRHYDLYNSGSHLHMVVLRANGTTYWVVNTLLDSISNETMLAIAKGLRPLKR